MTRICAWCGEVMDPGDPADPRVTHGICERCRVGARAEMDALFANERQEGQHENGGSHY